MGNGDHDGFHLLYLFKGAIIGVANIIPGVSGGTLAVVLGIYDKLIGAIGNFLTDSNNRRSYTIFLAQIGLGALLAIFLLSNIMDFLYENHKIPTLYFFIGLIIGSIPTVMKQHTDMRLNAPNSLFFIIGFIAVLSLELLNVSEANGGGSDYNIALFFVAGIASAAAMIVPGFSGSFVLVAMGVYWDLIDAVKAFDIVALIPPAIGGLIGIIGISKLINNIIKNHPSKFYYFIMGLIIASIFVLFPGLPSDKEILAASMATCVFGMLISLKLSK